MKSCPYVENICVYGDSFYNYVIALVIPNAHAMALLVKRMGKGDVTEEQVKNCYSDPQITAEVLRALQEHGKKAGLHKSEIPHHVKLCPEEWTPANGLLTAGLKIRRKQLKDFYSQDIEKMYLKQNSSSLLDVNGNIRSNKMQTQSG